MNQVGRIVKSISFTILIAFDHWNIVSVSCVIVVLCRVDSPTYGIGIIVPHFIYIT
jgi:hypothetical protein